MLGRQNHGVGGVRGDPCRGFPQAPAVCIGSTAEVTPAGVDIRAVGYPGHRRRLRPGGEGAEGDLRAGIVRGTGWRRTRDRVHLPASQTGGIGPSWPNPDGPWELDSVLCHHRTYFCSTQGTGVVTDGRPLGLPPGGLYGSLAKRPMVSRGGTGGNTGRVPGPTRMLTATGDKEQGLADSAAVHSKCDGAVVTGMLWRPIPTV